MSDKESILERLRANLAAIKKQTELCMTLFQRWGHPHRESENQVLALLRQWKALVSEAESAGLDVHKEISEHDLLFIRSQLELLKPPKPARLPMSVSGFLEDRWDNTARPAAKKSSVGHGLSDMVVY